MTDSEILAKRLVQAYTQRGLMIATAESCTGGMIAAAITDIAGSSAVLDRGFVTYSNEAKQEMIGVSAETLAAHGAVSRNVAIEMAEGALSRSNADRSVAVTGIAGPGGGYAQKPVGLVHLAVATKNGETRHWELRFGDTGRTNIRRDTVTRALEALLGDLTE
ncbi:MAG: CinA family protein [Alphaproteobacteria bacterium]|nr:CinA family protein [Alphaproteobacteria bacterium]